MISIPWMSDVSAERTIWETTSETFFFNDTATPEIYTTANTLSLHDALPIYTFLTRGTGFNRGPGETSRHGPANRAYDVPARIVAAQARRRDAAGRSACHAAYPGRTGDIDLACTDDGSRHRPVDLANRSDGVGLRRDVLLAGTQHRCPDTYRQPEPLHFDEPVFAGNIGFRMSTDSSACKNWVMLSCTA